MNGGMKLSAIHWKAQLCCCGCMFLTASLRGSSASKMAVSTIAEADANDLNLPTAAHMCQIAPHT
jgi:hypothetical protein